MTGNDIREKFLKFFVSQGHTPIKSASLIPQNDPTLYFTNAGMVPFKNIFTGEEKSTHSRATTSQKCMRVSGKHNDLENVGRTARHHTFFEMLGNFSFGDYFKKDAIKFAWDFLTKEVKIPKDRLWITVFENDDEAETLWHENQGVPKERIFRLGEKDNFWSMGDTGPCGPCSEIHYQFDSCTAYDSTHGKEWFLKNSDAGNIMEIWNLVFMQFERSADGKMTPLPKPSIDTGMGLERLAAVLQGKTTNYDSDLFTGILASIQKIVGKKYTHSDSENDVSMRVLADHIRATTFLISDGVLPSNEGRGYVLRRIMRRAIRHGKLLGQTAPFFYKLLPTLVSEMSSAYPELATNQTTVEKVIHAEEERFFETLDKGLKILNEEIERIVGAGSPRPIPPAPLIKGGAPSSSRGGGIGTLPGDIAFKLYDTYGFPLDLTELIAAEHGLTIDQSSFDAAMVEQKERARAGWKGSGATKTNEVYLELASTHSTKFLGYDTLESPAKIVVLIQNGTLVQEVTNGNCEMIFDQTPFYGEGGGQVGDRGSVTANSATAEILDTLKPSENLFVHKAKVKNGSFKIGDTVQLAVNRNVRRPTMRNHSATHLMHKALRDILGSHVRQAGSLVNDKILRFDFSHFEAIAPETLRKIEDAVNTAILNDLPIQKEVLNYDAAVKKGALAFFGDKYGDIVRVISMGDYSMEFCGGTHLNHTSEIGFFKIISEGSVAAGVRRIEAVTGEEAIKKAQDDAALIANLSGQLKAAPHEIPERLEKLKAQIKAGEKEIEKLRAKALSGNSEDLLKNALDVNGVKAIIHQADVDNAKALQEVSDMILSKLTSGICVAYAVIDGKVSLLVSVTKDLTAKFPANKILAPLAELISGRGGGKADRAQAGGTDVSRLGEMTGVLKNILSC